MACKECERRRQAMKEMLRKVHDHAARLLMIRKGENPDAKPTADLQASEAKYGDTQAEGSGQAGDAGAEHGQQGVEADPAAGAGEGRLQVPGVREAGGRARGARRSR